MYHRNEKNEVIEGFSDDYNTCSATPAWFVVLLILIIAAVVCGVGYKLLSKK